MTDRRIVQVITLPAESVVMSEDDYEYLAAHEITVKYLGQQLGLAEEGLANYAQELADTKAHYAQATTDLINEKEENQRLQQLIRVADDVGNKAANEIKRLKTACRILWHFGQPTVPGLRAEIIELADIGNAVPQSEPTNEKT